MYFATVDVQTGRLSGLVLTPMQVRRFRLNRAPGEEASWLLDMLDCECRRLGSRVQRDEDGAFRVVWTS
jgi:poly-gamma-glutamate synthesis protein (capsule biosynthesis protein)